MPTPDPARRQKHLDAHYYIARVLIPPLERIFNLVGADVRAWYDEMPKAVRADGAALSPKKALAMRAYANARDLPGHFHHAQCVVCGAAAAAGLCRACRARSVRRATAAALGEQVRGREERLRRAQAVCAVCAGAAPAQAVPCESLDCAWFFERHKAEAGMGLAGFANQLLEELNGLDEDEDGGDGEQEEDGQSGGTRLGGDIFEDLEYEDFCLL
jgi:DNA polymerase zeta